MNRRDLLKECGILLAAPTAIGLSGCSSNDGGDGNGGDADGAEDTPTDTPMPTPTNTPMPTDTPTQTDTQASTPSPTGTTTPTPAADDGGGSGGDDGGNGANGGGGSIESMCSVAQDRIEELTVVGCQSTPDDGQLAITVTVRNDGEQDAELNGHYVTATIYGASGTSRENDITGAISTHYPQTPGGTPPGETGDVEITVQPEEGVSVDEVQHYTISLYCRMFNEGVYCQ